MEGATVNTKWGPVNTEHILFIAAGAFNISKPSDLIPELQGRFPLRVELDSLGKEDFLRILIYAGNRRTPCRVLDYTTTAKNNGNNVYPEEEFNLALKNQMRYMLLASAAAYEFGQVNLAMRSV